MTGDRKKGVTIIKYKRPLKTFDPNFDTSIPSDQAVSVIGAIGPLNSQKEANAHSHTGSDVNADNIEINFSVKVNISVILKSSVNFNLNSPERQLMLKIIVQCQRCPG